MLVKHYSRNGDKFREHPDSVHLYTAPGEVKRYIFVNGQAVDIDRKILLGFSLIDGIENDQPQEFFLNGDEVTPEVFAEHLEQEYETKEHNILSHKYKSDLERWEAIERLRTFLSETVQDYPNKSRVYTYGEIDEALQS